MTQFGQQGQIIKGMQQNAGRDIINNIQNAAWKPLEMLPPRAQSFVGREQDIDWLLEQLTDDAGKVVALCGFGGMGKTALAAEVLSRLLARPDWQTRFPGGLFYYSFYPNPSLTVAFEELARALGEDPGADPHRAALRALSRRRTLLVFDGVEVLDDPLWLWELGGRHVVLVLSRRQSDAPDPARTRTLGVLPIEQGITLLQTLADSRAVDLSCVERLVRLINSYPLALQLIGSYLRSRQEEVADYLQWFEEEGLQALHHGEHHLQSVPILLQRTFDSLKPSEQEVCAVLGLLAPAPFPIELVQDMLSLPQRVVRQALGSLVNLSVLLRPQQHYVVSHALVHTFLKERLFSQASAASSPLAQTIATWQERLLSRLQAHFAQSDPYDRAAFALWFPHVRPQLSLTDLPAEQHLGAALLFNYAGINAFKQGKYAEAEPLLQRDLEICEQDLSSSHPDTANSLNNLAMLYQGQGKYEQAERLYQRALTICEQQLGMEHPRTQRIGGNYMTLLAEIHTNGDMETLLQLMGQEMLENDVMDEGLTGEAPLS